MTPLIGVVVVDHDGGDLTVRCVESLLTLEWPPERLRVVLVDNASVDSVASKLEGRDARLQVVRSETNLGFAGGCNAGIRRLLPDVDYVALLNNDAEAEPGWLGPLVDALEGDPTAGAASSKVLFSSPFVEVALEAPVHVPGRGDNRRLGVRVLGARVDGADGWSRTQFVRGFWGPEHDRGEGVPYQRSAGSALLRVPVAATAELLLAADRDVSVVLSSGSASVTVHVGTEPRWFAVPLAAAPVDVVNRDGGDPLTAG